MVKRYLKLKDIERVTAPSLKSPTLQSFGDGAIWSVSDLELFDRDEEAKKVAEIIEGILEARSPCISSISHAIEWRGFDANYKAIQRFLEKTDVKKALNRLYMEEGSFVIGDV